MKCKMKNSKDKVLPRQFTGNSKHKKIIVCFFNCVFFNTTKLVSTHGYHQMFNTEISSIIFFAAKHGEVLHNQKKKEKDQELTVAQTISSLLQNSDLHWRKSTRPFRNELKQTPYDWLYSGVDRWKNLDIVDRDPERLWMEVHNIVQEWPNHPKEKEM